MGVTMWSGLIWFRIGNSDGAPWGFPYKEGDFFN
jgi:hypothetical protein